MQIFLCFFQYWKRDICPIYKFTTNIISESQPHLIFFLFDFSNTKYCICKYLENFIIVYYYSGLSNIEDFFID